MEFKKLVLKHAFRYSKMNTEYLVFFEKYNIIKMMERQVWESSSKTVHKPIWDEIEDFLENDGERD